MTVSHDKNKDFKHDQKCRTCGIKEGPDADHVSGSEMLPLCYSRRVLVDSSPVKSEVYMCRLVVIFTFFFGHQISKGK